ncbi:fibronectin type III domain [Firmicutes bacterium CAG:194]|nr:fibronectin type III domain [Firmicutes bacterium CAG:194]
MNKMIKIKKAMVAFAAVLAMSLMLLPSVKADAAVTVLAAPKDAKQTISTETAVRVSWSAVPGATAYVYSYSSDNKTYTGEAMTGNGGKDTFINVAGANWAAGNTYYVKVRAFDGTKYSEAVVATVATAPKAPATMTQVAADNASATVSWAASTGATGYLIRFGATQATAKDIQVVKTTSVKLTGLSADSAYYLAVYPIRQVTTSFYASENCVENPRVLTTAPAVKGLKLASWDVKSNIVTLQWNNTAKYENGYQIEIYKADNKLVKTYNIYGRRAKSKTFILKSVKNTPFQYRVRTYTFMNGEKQYGAWSDLAYAIPQANVSAAKVSNNAVKLSWTKVPGAKNYTVYRATKEGGKFKKVATTKKAAYTVKNLKTYKDYYFYVKANRVSIGGKKRNSTKLDEQNDIYVYIQKYDNSVTTD